MTLTPADRAALQSAITTLEALVEVLKARSRPPHPDPERDDSLDRIDILNPELTALRQQLNELEAAAIVVRGPTPGEQQALTTALKALSVHVAADQAWEAFVRAADAVLDGAQKVAANVGGRRA